MFIVASPYPIRKWGDVPTISVHFSARIRRCGGLGPGGQSGRQPRAVNEMVTHLVKCNPEGVASQCDSSEASMANIQPAQMKQYEVSASISWLQISSALAWRVHSAMDAHLMATRPQCGSLIWRIAVMNLVWHGGRRLEDNQPAQWQRRRANSSGLGSAGSARWQRSPLAAAGSLHFGEASCSNKSGESGRPLRWRNGFSASSASLMRKAWR